MLNLQHAPLGQTTRPPAGPTEAGVEIVCRTCQGSGRTPGGRRCSTCRYTGRIRAPLCLCGCGQPARFANSSGAKFRAYAGFKCAAKASVAWRQQQRRINRSRRLYARLGLPAFKIWRERDGLEFSPEEARKVERLLVAMIDGIVQELEDRAYNAGRLLWRKRLRKTEADLAACAQALAACQAAQSGGGQP